MENKPLGQYKLSEGREVFRRAPAAGLNIFKRYLSRYFDQPKPSAAPLVHAMVLLGVFGYMLEYPHLSNNF